MPQRFIIA